jgi:hypothetical protein
MVQNLTCCATEGDERTDVNRVNSRTFLACCQNQMVVSNFWYVAEFFLRNLGNTVKFHLIECFCFSRFIQVDYAWIDRKKSKLYEYMHFSGWKRVSLEKLQCDLQRPYIFSHIFETFTSIIEVSRLGSLRWHLENTLYIQFLQSTFRLSNQIHSTLQCTNFSNTQTDLVRLMTRAARCPWARKGF